MAGTMAAAAAAQCDTKWCRWCMQMFAANAELNFKTVDSSASLGLFLPQLFVSSLD